MKEEIAESELRVIRLRGRKYALILSVCWEGGDCAATQIRLSDVLEALQEVLMLEEEGWEEAENTDVFSLKRVLAAHLRALSLSN